MLQRQMTPRVPPFPPLHLPKTEEQYLHPKIPLTILPCKGSAVMVFTLLFNGGDWYASKPGIAALTASMLTRGTRDHSAYEIAQTMEYYGAECTATCGRDTVYVKLAVPAVYFETLLPLFADIVRYPAFPEEELTQLKKIVKQRIHQVDADPARRAYELLQQQIFGSAHPYGYRLTTQQLATITRDLLAKHYQTTFWQQCRATLVGDIAPTTLPVLQKAFAQIQTTSTLTPKHTLSSQKSPQAYPQPSPQATICMGHSTITKSHPDYTALYITNKLLGGFFGARLMRNIREKKGYTYGISSAIIPYRHHSYWYTSTTVNKQYIDATCREIHKEIVTLQTSLLLEDELTLLKNYLTGELFGVLDNLFELDVRLGSLYLHQLDLSYYTSLYHTIQQIGAETIRTTAQKYLAPPTLAQMIIGG